MFMPGVWILWSKKKNCFVISFQKENGNTFTLFIIVKSLQKEQNSTNLLLRPPICLNKSAITPKWFNSLDTNSTSDFWLERLNKKRATFQGLHIFALILLFWKSLLIWWNLRKSWFNPSFCRKWPLARDRLDH